MTGDRQAILDRIKYFEEEGLGWYQDIDLGDGIHTKSRRLWGEELDHPRLRWDEIKRAVPESLAGKSVLDIGCNAGWICFEAMDRGATDVVGVDLKPGYIEQAKFCAEVRGQDVDFRALDIYDLGQLDRTFDVVFCVGILYHCKHLSRAVEAVSKVAASTLIVETAIHPGHNELPLVRFVRSSGYVGPDADGAARLPGHWHPNMTSLKEMFYGEGFTEIEELFTVGGRGGIVARR